MQHEYEVRPAMMAGKRIFQVVQKETGIICCNEATAEAAEAHLEIVKLADKKNSDEVARRNGLGQ